MSCVCKALVFVERGPSSPHLRCWFAAGPEIEPPAASHPIAEGQFKKYDVTHGFHDDARYAPGRTLA